MDLTYKQYLNKSTLKKIVNNKKIKICSLDNLKVVRNTHYAEHSGISSNGDL